MKNFLFILFLITTSAFAQVQFNLNSSIENTSSMPFITHSSNDQTSFENSLALNVEYFQIQSLRETIELMTGKKLKFFTGWDPNGEAHVTTITPPEFVFALNKFISMNRINEIAKEEKIQSSDLNILGLGSAKRIIEGQEEETFFLIVDSLKLRSIRFKIHKEFVKNGGNPKDFDPGWFFPHITIGFTKTDLHENKGVIKNLKHSFDNRLLIKIY